jgi:hypothetical protein
MMPAATDEILLLVRSGLLGAAVPEMLFTLRDRGRRVAQGWATDLAGLASGVMFTTVEVTLARDAVPLDAAMLRKSLAHAHRGLWGLGVHTGDGVIRMGPLEMLARNLGPNAALRQMGAGDAFQFPVQCFLVNLAQGTCVQLHRGQQLVAQRNITRASVQAMGQGMLAWLVAQVGPDGRTTYKYWPSTGAYATSNNMIRQFMGTAALALGAAGAVADRNAAYNFGQFYRDEGAFGVIDEAGKVKLGAAAVALIALINRGEHGSHRATQLLAFIAHMQNADGSFRTFLRPFGRNDCQNFYPGEAMLALARLHAVTGDAALLTRIGQAFQYYRDWHRAQRNPAFVPWHTMALCYLHQVTGRRDISEFVFEMNDWLIGMQAVDATQPDTVGEFYDATRAHFGPPHASSTGVYLEGLIDAWSLAKRLGDTRAEVYRHAILRGLRSLRQLQYRNDDAMFYIRHKARVRGAIRTSTHNNEVRIDNVQHGLMAIWHVLERFDEADWQM